MRKASRCWWVAGLVFAATVGCQTPPSGVEPGVPQVNGGPIYYSPNLAGAAPAQGTGGQPAGPTAPAPSNPSADATAR